MAVDLKSITPDTSLPQTGFLFGADSQSASAPSVYPVANVKDALNSGIGTLASEPAITWDTAANPVATVTLTSNSTLYATNFKAGGTYKLVVFQDATGGRTLSYDPNFKWPNDTIPTVSSGANAMTVFEFVSNGTYLYGTVSQAYDGSPAPTVSGLFARPANDYSTLSTLSSMPTGGAVSRNGQAMQYDSTGRLTWAANNIVRQSNTFTTTWTTALASVALTTATTDPFGGNSAYKLAESTTTAGAHTLQQTGITTVAGVSYLLSFYVKAAERTQTQIQFFDGTTNKYPTFNIPTGAGGSVTKAVDGLIGTSWSFVDAGNGWYRIAIYVTAATASGQVYIYPSSSNTNNYAGTVGSGIYIYGCQLEAVTWQSFARDYLDTGSSARFEPRFDVDPVTLQAKGLLVEGARTNLLTNSNLIADTVALTGGTGTLPAVNSSYSATAPDGTGTVKRIQFNRGAGTTANDFSVVSAAVTAATAGQTYTNSLYVRATSGTQTVYFYITGGAFTGAMGSVFSVTSTSWTRVTYSRTATNNGAVNFAIGLVGNDGSGVATSDVLVWGGQQELGAGATSYIPTQASTVTRAAETFTLTGYANRLIEAYWIDQETGVASSIPETVVSSGAVTINPPQFGWVTSLRAYTNAYAGDIATPSWIDNSGTNGNRMVTDSTGTLTWAPSNLFSNSASPSQTNTISAGIEGGGDYIVSYYGGGTLVLKQTNSAGAVITPSSTGTVSSRNYAKFTVPNGVSAVYIDFGAAATNAQLERVTYQTQPRALIETSGSARFMPRYDFDAATTPASPRGMLIEESRSNLLLYSQSFATWTLNSINVTTGVIAPDGTTSGNALTFTSTAASMFQSANVTAGQAYTASIWLKGSGASIGKTARFWIWYAGTATGSNAIVDVVLTGAWQRVTVSSTPTGSGSVYVRLDPEGINTSVSGDVVHAWGAQLEAGAFATSYIPTTTGSVQRVADVVKLSGTALTTLQGAAYSAIVEVAGVKSSAGFGQLLSESSLTFLAVNGGSTTDIYTQLQAGTQVITPLGSGGLTTGTFRAAMSANASGVSVVGNNGTVATSSGTKLTVSNVWIGSRSGSSFAINNPIRAIAVYNSRLPDATLKTKSTVGASF